MLRDRQALLDIIKATQQVLDYAQDLTQIELCQNDEKQAAILYRLIIIGEATKRLSTDFRDQYSTIPWRQMAGLRDVVIHDYDELDTNILWNVITLNLPGILWMLQILLSQLDPGAITD
ncbi:MAG: DUF86 domain-containing protein [Cyanophyceae cyanobacterium]